MNCICLVVLLIVSITGANNDDDYTSVQSGSGLTEEAIDDPSSVENNQKVELDSNAGLCQDSNARNAANAPGVDSESEDERERMNAPSPFVRQMRRFRHYRRPVLNSQEVQIAQPPREEAPCSQSNELEVSSSSQASALIGSSCLAQISQDLVGATGLTNNSYTSPASTSEENENLPVEQNAPLAQAPSTSHTFGTYPNSILRNREVNQDEEVGNVAQNHLERRPSFVRFDISVQVRHYDLDSEAFEAREKLRRRLAQQQSDSS